MHLAGIGTGVVRDVRTADRCVVEIKGRRMIVAAAQLTRAEPQRSRLTATRVPGRSGDDPPAAGRAPRMLDLHGRTVAEAVETLDAFLNDALLAGETVVHVIHGRSGGRVKSAVHARLRELTAVRRFALDARNAGVTIVVL